MEPSYWNQRVSKFFVYTFYAVAFGLPLLRPSWHGVLVGLLIVMWLLADGASHLMTGIKSYTIMLVFSAIFLVDVAGLIHTENFEYGLSYLETELPLLVLPIIIFSSATILTPIIIRRIFLFFIAGVITLNLASLGFISYDMWDPRRLEANLVIANNSIVKIHPVFLSVFIGFSLLFVFDSFFPLRKFNRNKLGWILFSIAVLLVYLFWLNSRIGIFAFLIAALFYVFYFTKNRSRVYSLLSVILFVGLLFVVPFSRQRFFDAPMEMMKKGSQVDMKDYNTRAFYLRSKIYQSSYTIIDSPVVFYGYGTGDFKDVLQEFYAQQGYADLVDRRLDSHSEYFAQLHRTGIAGLLLFLLALLVPFYFAIKYKSALYGSFIILFGVTAVFENILSSQKGVTFFAMTSPLLFLYAKSIWRRNSQNGLSTEHHL